MENKNKVKSMLMAGTIMAAGVLGAGETTQQDNRNFFEKAVHTTTSLVDKGVHAITETALYPVRGTAWLLSEGGRYARKGLNFVGENTGSVARMVTNPVGKGIDYGLNLTASAVEGTANLVQSAVEYPVAMAGSALDAGATATRDPQTAGHTFVKEAGILTAGTASGAMIQPLAVANKAVAAVEDIARTTVKGAADVVADGVWLVDKQAGQKLQENIDVADGGAIALQTANALTRGFVTAAPSVATMASPLLNEDIRGAFIEGVYGKMLEHPDEKLPEVAQGTIVEPAKQIAEEVQKTAEKMTPSSLKQLLGSLSRTIDAAEQKSLNDPTPAPDYKPLSGGRDGVKDLVQHSEIIRNRNAGR